MKVYKNGKAFEYKRINLRYEDSWTQAISFHYWNGKWVRSEELKLPIINDADCCLILNGNNITIKGRIDNMAIGVVLARIKTGSNTFGDWIETAFDRTTGDWVFDHHCQQDGVQTIEFQAIDWAGNTSLEPHNSCKMVTGVNPAIKLRLQQTKDTGFANDDNLTRLNNLNFEFSMTLPVPDATTVLTKANVTDVQIEHIESGNLATGTLDNFGYGGTQQNQFSTAGNFAFIAEGTHTFRARWKDSKGTWSNWSSKITVIIDTTAPAKPVITTDTNFVFIGSEITIAGTAKES
jgi:hypothetical protein